MWPFNKNKKKNLSTVTLTLVFRNEELRVGNALTVLSGAVSRALKEWVPADLSQEMSRVASLLHKEKDGSYTMNVTEKDVRCVDDIVVRLDEHVLGTGLPMQEQIHDAVAGLQEICQREWNAAMAAA